MNYFTGLIPVAWMPGTGEWIAIFVIILLLFGAKRLPELARALGSAKKEFQKGAREISEEIEKDSTKNSKNGDSSKKT